MLYMCLAVIAFVHILPWIIRKGDWAKDPSKFISILSGLTVIPYFLLICIGYRSNILAGYTDEDLTYLLIKFSVLYSLGIIFAYIGVELGRKVRFRSFPINNGLSKKTIILLIMLLGSFFIFGTFEKITHAGGLGFFMENMARRSELLSGSGFFALLVDPVAFMIVFLLLYSYNINKWPSIYAVIFVIFLLFMGLAIFGGRKLPMYLVIFSVVAYHIYVKPVKFLSINNIVIIFFLGVFFIWMLSFRGSTELHEVSAIQVFKESIANTSYIDTYVFIIEYFDRHGYWYGAAFKDIFIRFGLTSLADFHVPLDDGVYVRTLVQGWSVYPPEKFELMYPSSLPPESFGNGYLNFGFLGVFLFFIIKGFVSGLFYSVLERSNWAPTLFYLFLFVVFNFHLTNLRVIQLLFVAIPVLFFHYLLSRRFWR